MFSKRSKPFISSNIFFCFRKFLSVANGMMFYKTRQRTITSEGIGDLNRSLLSMLDDVFHQFISCDRINNLGVNASIAFRQGKNNAFSSCSTSPFPFTAAAKIRFVQFDFSFEFSRFQFTHVINRFSKFLIHSCYRLIIYTEITCQTIRRLLLIKPSYNFQLSAKKFHPFCF